MPLSYYNKPAALKPVIIINGYKYICINIFIIFRSWYIISKGKKYYRLDSFNPELDIGIEPVSFKEIRALFYSNFSFFKEEFK